MDFKIGSCNYTIKDRQFKDGFAVGTHVYKTNISLENLKFIDYSSKSEKETEIKFRFMRQTDEKPYK